MKASTSTRISLWFSGLVISITVILSLLINIFFFQDRYRAEKWMINNFINTESQKQPPLMKRLRWKFSPVIQLRPGDELFQEFKQLSNENKIFAYESERYMSKINKNTIYINNVTRSFKRQKALALLSLLSILFSWIIWFLLSKLLVKNWLKDLHTLHKEVSGQDIDNLHVVSDYDHLPEDDEIAVLAQTFRKNSLLLEQQIQDMQNFISNASHELRTPLMTLRARQDLAKKSKNYEWLIDDNIEAIERLQSLIGWLLLLSQKKTENHSPIENVNIYDITNQITTEYSSLYDEKNITINNNIDTSITAHAPMFAIHTIIKNLIENAYKYTNQNGIITITSDTNQFNITNTGSYISQDEIDQVRKTFWQSDTARSNSEWFGLWLSIVKRLCVVFWFWITVHSNKESGTTFTLTWE